MENIGTLSNISLKSFRVWQRNAQVLRATLWVSFLPPLLEPILYVFAFGFGLGGLVGMVTYEGNTIRYLNFMAPGTVAVAIMYWAYFETSYNSYVRMHYQKTFDAILATPLLVEDIVAGEWVWGATKSVIASAIMMTMLSLLGLVTYPSGLLVFPVALFGGAIFSALGLITTAYVPHISMFNVPIFLLIFPMFLFSGTFFPLDILPAWAKVVAYGLPLTHVSTLVRGACLGNVPEYWYLNLAYLILVGGILSYISFSAMVRRLVK